MANGLKKPISTIKTGDKVLSAKTLKPVKVLIFDEEELGDRKLIGFNDQKPFVTEDHCFINPADPNNRLTFNLEKSVKAKHWKNIGEIQEGTEIIKDGNIFNIGDIKNITKSPNTKVYDIITEDNSYIANGYYVYDDFPEIEKHQFKSLVLLEICKMVQDYQFESKEEIQTVLTEIYYNNINEAINRVKQITITPIILKQRFDEFVEIVNRNYNILYVGSRLWRTYLPKINEKASTLNIGDKHRSQMITV
jgi:hypothetical protein